MLKEFVNGHRREFLNKKLEDVLQDGIKLLAKDGRPSVDLISLEQYPLYILNDAKQSIEIF